ncbi:SEFIR domain-containing protein [Comamonas odontotermitis]|uniref:SEFIR domain-containing protein n=1 Tax=Comamonas odontotermitis TaxID=379895 RepID=UPI0037524B4E
MNAPKLFISYCWSNPEHEQWVLDLASDLVEAGVDTILDKWNLKEGHDAIAFMESMVTDPSIQKVVIVSDATYVAKADGRLGGVGTETQIISKKVYDSQTQDKFVAVVAQRDENGKAYLPTYYSSRIYIDLSDDDRRAPEFEKLLRWIYNKPLHVRPELGKIPAFLQDGEHISLGTSMLAKRCIDAIKNHKPTASGALDEYCERFTQNLERFRIKESTEPLDELIIRSIEEMLPYRNEFISLMISIAQYAPSEDHINRMHSFFEKLMIYMYIRPNNGLHRTDDLDNFKYFVHELFLYMLAILLKYERFEEANLFLSKRYYTPSVSGRANEPMVSYLEFRDYAQSFEHRNTRLKSNRKSMRADLLHDRCSGLGIDFRYVMQADFVAYLRAEFASTLGFGGWWPETLLYASQMHGPFEIFARSSSKAYFNKIKALLAVETRDDVAQALSRMDGRNTSERPLGWSSAYELMGFKTLATEP